MQEKISAPDLPGNDMVRELRACEIRTHYSALDPLTLQAEAMTWAGDTRHHEKLMAVLDAPVATLSDEVADRLREAMAVITSPEVSRQIAELAASRDAVTSAVRAAMAILRQNGLAADDP